jgi:hypothetical protein
MSSRRRRGVAGSRIARSRRRAVCGEHPRSGQTASRRQQPVRPRSSGSRPRNSQRAHGTYDELTKGGGFDARAFIADLGSSAISQATIWDPASHRRPALTPGPSAAVAELIASDLRKVDIKVVLTRRATSRRIATGFDDGRSLATCATRRRRLARQPEPPTLVLNEPGCYHFRVLDPRLPLRC